MDQDNRKGRICGLIAAGLRLEGLLRVAMERQDVEAEALPQIREAFAMYTALFNSIFPAVDESADAVGSVEVKAETEQEPEPAQEPERELGQPCVEDESEEEPEEEIREADSEFCVGIENEPEDEAVEIAAAQEDTAPETEVQCESEADAAPAVEYAPVRPLADTLKVDELIARKESADLRRAFTLNDKFRFRRTIFGGSDELFSSTLVRLEEQPDFDSALELLGGILPENGEDNDDFLAIVKAHFESRQ